MVSAIVAFTYSKIDRISYAEVPVYGWRRVTACTMSFSDATSARSRTAFPRVPATPSSMCYNSSRINRSESNIRIDILIMKKSVSSLQEQPKHPKEKMFVILWVLDRGCFLPFGALSKLYHLIEYICFRI